MATRDSSDSSETARSEGVGPSPEAVRQSLAELLGSSAFKASPQRRKLLAYVVEQTLAGLGHRLKAFELAVAVLGRDAQFDPQNDPVVRVEMARLRRELDDYHQAEGRHEPVRISIPKGHYVPSFEARAIAMAPGTAAGAPAEPAWRWLGGRSAML